MCLWMIRLKFGVLGVWVFSFLQVVCILVVFMVLILNDFERMELILLIFVMWYLWLDLVMCINKVLSVSCLFGFGNGCCVFGVFFRCVINLFYMCCFFCLLGNNVKEWVVEYNGQLWGICINLFYCCICVYIVFQEIEIKVIWVSLNVVFVCLQFK